MTYTSALPPETDEKPLTPAQRSALALKSMKAAIDRRGYDKPPTPHDKLVMHRLMGERDD